MRRTSLLVAVLLVVGVLAAPTVGAMTQDEQAAEQDVSPGERLSGVVGVQEAELDGELESNAFTIALERADDNATEASHIADRLNETEERLEELEERKAELEDEREAGEITEGQYQAEMAQVATEVDNVEDQLNQSEEAAGELPDETLEENGVNVTAIQTLKANADELTGEEVAESARTIAGDENGEVDRDDRRDEAGERDDQGDEAGDRDGQGDEADEQRNTADDRDTEQPDDEGEDGDAGSENGQADEDDRSADGDAP